MAPHMSYNERLRQYWPYYVSQHLTPQCRGLHFAGTGLALSCFLLGLLHSLSWWLLMPVFGYGLAWVGHFVYERNRPAAWKDPYLALLADLRMFWLTLGGQMDREVDRVRREMGID